MNTLLLRQELADLIWILESLNFQMASNPDFDVRTGLRSLTRRVQWG